MIKEYDKEFNDWVRESLYEMYSRGVFLRKNMGLHTICSHTTHRRFSEKGRYLDVTAAYDTRIRDFYGVEPHPTKRPYDPGFWDEFFSYMWSDEK